MSNLAELRKRVAQINEQVETLNRQRERNQGRLDTLTNQLTKELQNYSDTYGVKLSDATSIQKECARVAQDTEQKAGFIETALGYIQRGEYAECCRHLGVKMPNDTVITSDDETGLPVMSEGVNVTAPLQAQEDAVQASAKEMAESLRGTMTDVQADTYSVPNGVDASDPFEDDDDFASVPVPVAKAPEKKAPAPAPAKKAPSPASQPAFFGGFDGTVDIPASAGKPATQPSQGADTGSAKPKRKNLSALSAVASQSPVADVLTEEDAPMAAMVGFSKPGAAPAPAPAKSDKDSGGSSMLGSLDDLFDDD